jgi:hypothetical protein
LQEIAPNDPNFRLYKAGWLGKVHVREVMEVTSAAFRYALRGPEEGKLSIMVPGTTRTVHVTASEMDAAEASA